MTAVTAKLARGAQLLWMGATCAVACTGEQTVILGNVTPLPVFSDFIDGNSEVVEFAAGLPVASINGDDDDENPSLTADLLEIYFTSRRQEGPGAGDIWTARRDDRTLPFSPPQPVQAANTEFTETSSAISLDGLSLWFGSNRPGAMGGDEDVDIWVMQRTSRDAPWSAPRLAELLNSPQNDIPRPPGGGGRIMPLSSERDTSGYYQTYLATLDAQGTVLAAPRLLGSLVVPGQSVVDAFLTEDALGLFYNRAADNQDAELEFAWRWDRDSPFDNSIALDSINTLADDRDPWLSPGEDLLFFTTNRRGNEEIYATQVQFPSRR